jgi:hypothetical protein
MGRALARPYSMKKSFNEFDNKEMAQAVKQLLVFLDMRIEESGNYVAERPQVSHDRSRKLGQLTAYTECLRVTIMDAFPGSDKLYRELIASGEVRGPVKWTA